MLRPFVRVTVFAAPQQAHGFLLKSCGWAAGSVYRGRGVQDLGKVWVWKKKQTNHKTNNKAQNIYKHIF